MSTITSFLKISKQVMGDFSKINALTNMINDTFNDQSSRLAIINDGLQTQAQLQQKIFDAAQRSRSEYSGTASAVARLGVLANGAFKNNDETIAFVELLNKSFRVSNMSISESAMAMDQLTKAMAAGGLQGNDFYNILKSALSVAQAIGTYMGKSTGEILQMSQQGKITADIIKNALFSSADNINSKFKLLPMTICDVWIDIKNTALKSFSEVMIKINSFLNSDLGKASIQGLITSIAIMAAVLGWVFDRVVEVATFFRNNWSLIIPVLWGVIGALIILNGQMFLSMINTAKDIILKGIHAFASAGETLAIIGLTLAQEGFNAALALCPITWIIGAIIILIALFYGVIAVINKLTGSNTSATGLIAGAFMWLIACIGNLFIGLYNMIINIVAVIWNHFASFAEFFANFMDDPIGSIVRLFAGMADSVLGILKTIATGIDTIFGSHLADTVAGWQDGLKGAVTNLVGEAKIKVPRMDARSMQLERLKPEDSFNKGYKAGESFEKNFDLSKLMGGLGTDTDILKTIATNTGVTADSVEMSGEDMKYLRDISERDNINRYTTAEISMKMTNHNKIDSKQDIDGIVSHIENKMYESMLVMAEGV